MKKKLSIIIVTYNSLIYIKDLFDSLVKQKNIDFDVIVVDNNSTDWCLSSIEEYKEKLDIKFIKNTSNTWFAKANNQWMILAQSNWSDAVLLLNHDTILSIDLLDKSIDKLFSDNKIWALVPTILYRKPNEEYIWWIWTKGRTIRNMIKNHTIKPTYHIHKNKKIDEIASVRTEETEYLTWCAMFVKNEVLDKVWLLDEWFFMYFEDADWSSRIKMYWYKLYHLAWTVVYHNTPMHTSSTTDVYAWIKKKNRYLTSLIKFIVLRWIRN